MKPARWTFFALCTLYFALSACARPVEEHHGRTGEVIAESYGSRIEAKLGPSISVQTARAAAEATLRARGYVITETYGTRDRMKIQASGTGDSRSETTTIEAWAGSGTAGTRVRVDSGLFGSDAAPRAILDEMLARLGR